MVTYVLSTANFFGNMHMCIPECKLPPGVLPAFDILAAPWHPSRKKRGPKRLRQPLDVQRGRSLRSNTASKPATVGACVLRQGRAPGGTKAAKLPGLRPLGPLSTPWVTVTSPRVVPPVGLVGDDGVNRVALPCKYRFFACIFNLGCGAALPRPKGARFLGTGVACDVHT